ncbi:MAG: efflux RND transporter permease subunit [Oligoflexia bacterium]|nr:efflux RND transporter permease subunit [Oligoflexia bacterium]MBF0364443.1 efflux RND transporter permease subunit [Oligoflexia bacterium]
MTPVGMAGQIARQFLNSKLTLLLVITSLMLGVFAVYMTPKEEEPQIKVPMVDILIPVPGYSPKEVEKRVASIVEREMSALTAIKHIYSTSLESAALITVRFEVGEDLETSLVKIHHKMTALKDMLPAEAMNAKITSYTIDDVPFYAVTFSSHKLSSAMIREKIVPLAKSLQAINGIGNLDIIGGERKVVAITPQLKELSRLGITLIELKQAVERASSEYMVATIKERSPEPVLFVGSFVKNIADIKQIPIGRRSGKALTLGDVAKVTLDYDHINHHVSSGKEGAAAVTITYTKKRGENATILASALHDKLQELAPLYLGKDQEIAWEITRDYGATAKEKSNELLEHLVIATISVMALIAITMGIRVSLVVGIAVPVTLALTLLIYYLLGYTLNRVTLFALIFSIGILVDDAIVVVENIYRHLSLGIHKARDIAITIATDEVGNPTILATLTVIVAIMPMAFVGGLMGPYMRPIPIGASLAMIFSLLIAFMVTPWASKKIISDKPHAHEHEHKEHSEGKIATLFRAAMAWIIEKKSHTIIIFAIVFVLLLASLSLVLTKQVMVKMLPFDNKSEFQVLIDLPAGATLEDTKSVANELSEKLYTYPDVKSIQTYVGVAAPFNFSGMVKHTFMRAQSYRADLQVNLLDKHERKIQGHDLVKKIREETKDFLVRYPGLLLQYLEIPPGPPVLSTVLAEIYASNEEQQRSAVQDVVAVYHNTEGMVETDSTLDKGAPTLLYDFNRSKGVLHGVPQNFATNTLLMALGELNIFTLHKEGEEEPIFMRMSLPAEAKKSDGEILSLLVPSLEGDKVPLKNLIEIKKSETRNPIYHKDLRPVMYVMGEVSGDEESPFYAITKMNPKLEDKFDLLYIGTPPASSARPILKWDGEMDITLEVFHDLGIAFMIAIILIIIIVIGWYNSFLLPFIIVVPIPLTLIGIIPGHFLMNSFFTATSMIGFIAGAGITVRNSIILIDFIEEKRLQGCDCKSAIIDSTIIRFRPILLTALAVLVAGFVILFDPIFQGLAISLMSGSVISALLSIPLVPVLYYWFYKSRPAVKSVKQV